MQNDLLGDDMKNLTHEEKGQLIKEWIEQQNII